MPGGCDKIHYAVCSKFAVYRVDLREVLDVRILLHVLLIVVSLGLIVTVLLQKGKSAGLSGAITGGAEHLFGKQKARGLDLFLSRLTLVLATAFIILSLVVSYIVKD